MHILSHNLQKQNDWLVKQNVQIYRRCVSIRILFFYLYHPPLPFLYSYIRLELICMIHIHYNSYSLRFIFIVIHIHCNSYSLQFKFIRVFQTRDTDSMIMKEPTRSVASKVGWFFLFAFPFLSYRRINYKTYFSFLTFACSSFSGKLLLFYIYSFHVLIHLLLIYICKLHWNLNTMFVCQVNYFWFTYVISMS